MTHPTERAKETGHKCFRPEAWFPALRAPPAPLQQYPHPPLLHPISLPPKVFPMVISWQVFPQPNAPHHHEYCLASSAYLQVHPPPTATPPASPEAPTTPLPPRFPHLGLFGCKKWHGRLLCREAVGLVTQHQPGG